MVEERWVDVVEGRLVGMVEGSCGKGEVGGVVEVRWVAMVEGGWLW